MPVQPAPGLGHASRTPRTATPCPPALGRLIGSLTVLVLAACTPTRITLTATPEAMEAIETVYVVAGETEKLEEALGGDKSGRDLYNFTETLRADSASKAGAIAFVELREYTPEELNEATTAAQQIGGKPLPSTRWQVTEPSISPWLDTDFDRLGDAIVARIKKSGFKYNPTLSIAIIVGATENNGDTWDHFCTLIPTQELMPGGFWFITRGKELTFDLKARDNPERLVGSKKLNSQAP